MQIKTRTMKIGGSIYLRIPPAMVQHLEIDSSGTAQLTIQDEQGKRGKYMSAWKSQQE